MTVIGIFVFVLMTAIAALHAAWGFGLYWPARDERGLVGLVLGRTGQTHMPRLGQCLLAATAIFMAGLFALALSSGWKLSGMPVLVTAAGALATLIFAGRGIAAYVPAWRRRFAQEPFASMDRTWYGPFCLMLAVGYFAMTAGRMVN